jgi:hypothetical protein
MQRGRSPYEEGPISLRLRCEILVAQFAQMCLGAARKEFLAVVAIKPEQGAATRGH